LQNHQFPSERSWQVDSAMYSRFHCVSGILTKHCVTFLHLNFRSKLCINRVLAAGLENDLYKDWC